MIHYEEVQAYFGKGLRLNCMLQAISPSLSSTQLRPPYLSWSEESQKHSSYAVIKAFFTDMPADLPAAILCVNGLIESDVPHSAADLLKIYPRGAYTAFVAIGADLKVCPSR